MDWRSKLVRAKEFEEACVAKIFLQIGALTYIFRINLRDRQTVSPKVPGKLKERDVLFAHMIQNADGTKSPAGQSHNGTPRAAQLTLKRMHLFCR
jgi:hypothetical protein